MVSKKASTKKTSSSISSTPHKYLFIVGGVMSGVGKGVASSSIGTILKARGLSVTALKIDPYINVDAGTMNPTEHGEVFVMDSGLETDQDMGNYERFLDQTLPAINYMTTGSVYLSVIEKERNLEYKGKNVQVVPDIPLDVIQRIESAAEEAQADVTIVEIGGTVGEYENILFLEAARMMKQKYPDDVATALVSYLPVPGSIGEMKTKPTQHASRTLNSAGVFADIIIARSRLGIDAKRKDKIARFCNVLPEHVISAPDVKSIYDVPVNFEKDHLGDILCELFDLSCKSSNLKKWSDFVRKVHRAKKEVKIGIAGKYFKSGEFVLSDVYISVIEALKFSAYQQNLKPVIEYIDTREYDLPRRQAGKGGSLAKLKKYDGILIPGGCGREGIEGKLKIIKFCRENKVPYFGLCYGMQLATLEYARNVLGLKKANTVEIDPKTPHPIIDVMPDQKELIARGDYGGTMRLGAYPCVLKKGSVAGKAYGKARISERHRHRYEVNPEYVKSLEEAGLVFSGTSPDHTLMEIAELPKSEHPFFLGTQFHPEFLARPLTPHPLFSAFIKASSKK